MGFLYFLLDFSKIVHLKNIILTIIIATTLPCIIAQGNYSEELYITEPEFVQPIGNLTVQQGSNVSLPCIVNNIGNYRTAWIKADSKLILSIHTHVITRNSRLSVSHDGNITWELHISPVLLYDSGHYMCQVNTDPIIMQSTYLTVVLPPDTLNIRDINYGYKKVGYYNESGRIQLTCDTPRIPGEMKQWRREDGKDITLRSQTGQSHAVEFIQGERLYLKHIHRSDMGVYICSTFNGVSPIGRYGFEVRINFPPTVKAVSELVALPVERAATLECVLEVYPKRVTGWYRNNGKVNLHDGEKYEISEIMINMYTWKLRLTVKNLQITDFGSYSCSSTNFFAKSEAYIRLQELRFPPKHNLL